MISIQYGKADNTDMMISYPYKEIFDRTEVFPEQISLVDHLNGFDSHLKNLVLNKLDIIAATQNKRQVVIYHNILNDVVKQQYTNLDLRFSFELQDYLNLSCMNGYKIHPRINIKNFLCSFNGSGHHSRKMLSSALNVFGYFNKEYCSKNTKFSNQELDEHIHYLSNNDRFYKKFFFNNNSDEFSQYINSFGHVRFDHANNIYNLENKLTESFLHIVSETMADSYHPFVTEKVLYSIVTRGLFVAYAQPGWHEHLEKYYGFKRYTKLFDYRFDNIFNPVERLVELMTMVGKFAHLSHADLYDLYLMEQDTIDFNHDHYFSGNYLTHLKQYDDR